MYPLSIDLSLRLTPNNASLLAPTLNSNSTTHFFPNLTPKDHPVARSGYPFWEFVRMPPEKVRIQTRIMAAQVLRRDDDDENGQRRDAALKAIWYV